jgi:hypothetical protein
MRFLLGSVLIAANCLGQTFGIWKLNAAQSTFAGDTQPQNLLMRIERHARGEVVTVDRTEADGRVTSTSTLLYLDGAARDFEDAACSGTQSSRRLDGFTIEIFRQCSSGAWIKFIQHLAIPTKELTLEITEQRAGGRLFERHLVLEKEQEKK